MKPLQEDDIREGWDCGNDIPDPSVLEIQCKTPEEAKERKREILRALNNINKIEDWIKKKLHSLDNQTISLGDYAYELSQRVERNNLQELQDIINPFCPDCASEGKSQCECHRK